jgi:hypothetical protein
MNIEYSPVKLLSEMIYYLLSFIRKSKSDPTDPPIYPLVIFNELEIKKQNNSSKIVKEN